MTNGVFNCQLNSNDNEEFIFYFKTKKSQILFEFWYLVVIFIVFAIVLFLINLNVIPLNFSTKRALYSFFGGFYGGWVFDTKWFYRVTARGKNNQKTCKWEAHKIYWRILTPFLSATLSFAIYAVTISNIIPFITVNANSGMAAFGFSFVMGCFSDIAFNKLVEWTVVLWGGKEKGEND